VAGLVTFGLIGGIVTGVLLSYDKIVTTTQTTGIILFFLHKNEFSL